MAGAVLAVVTVSGVSAYWQAQQTIPGTVVTSGDLEVSATWEGTTPEWGSLFPGGVTPGATLRVETTANGENLRWLLLVNGQFPVAAADSAVLDVREGTCTQPGSPLTAAGLGPFTGSSTIFLCIRMSLKSTAPNSLQGQQIAPQLTITTEQVAQ